MSIVSVRPIGATAAGLCLVLSACGAASTTATPISAPPPARTLTVFVAGSLTDLFNRLGHRFETENPGVTVKFNSTAPSSDLAKQIVAGSAADVFAPAGDAAMKTVTDAMKADGTPVIFATNVLEIATAPGNPKGITSLADLAKPDVKVAVCDPTAACGMAALKVQQASGVTLKPVSEEPSLKAVLSDVTTGSADAGLVYATDIAAATTTVHGVMFPESSKAITNYPIVVLKGTPQTDLARKFVELVTGQMAHTMFNGAGFGTN